MTYADDFNLRQAIASGDNIAAAVDGLLVAYSAQELSASINTTSVTSVVYTSSSITVTVPDGAIVEVMAHIRVSHGTNNVNAVVTVEQDAVDLTPACRFNSHRADTNGRDESLFFTKILAPAAGAHTYKIKWSTSSGTLYSDNAYMSIKVFQNS